MSNREKQQELLGKMEAFFSSDNLTDKRLILGSIYKEVLSYTYSPSDAGLFDLSLTIWKQDIEFYLSRFPNNAHLEDDTRLSLSGVIMFVLKAQ